MTSAALTPLEKYQAKSRKILDNYEVEVQLAREKRNGKIRVAEEEFRDSTKEAWQRRESRKQTAWEEYQKAIREDTSALH